MGYRKLCKVRWVLGVLLVLMLLACREREPATPSPEQSAPGEVRANAAYRTWFGEAPVPEEGTCYARVGFFPLRSQEGVLSPTPFFLFREGDQLSLLLGQLASGELRFPERSRLYNPFPEGSRIRVLSEFEGMLTVGLDLPSVVPTGTLEVMAAAIRETAFQFEEIEQVTLEVNGEHLSDPFFTGAKRGMTAVVPPGPPELLMLTGSWEAGSDGPSEVLANFDRPVEVGFFRLTDASGEKLAGDYYRSAFDMSVVLHPAEPERLREGRMLHAQWKVTDRLGRSAEGAGLVEMQRHDHP